MENKDFQRYSRQILFEPIGLIGQERLNKSRVAIVGMGALGTVIANHLTRSGIGFLKLIDRDYVEKSNLQRQMLYDEQDALSNQPKAIAAYKKLIKINPSIEIEPFVTDLHAWNASELLADVDLILDGTDNFLTRYLINDVSIKFNIPWVYGGAVRSRGMFAVFMPDEGPCYRCLFPTPPNSQTETCDMVGVISSVTHAVASFQAAEAIKIMTNNNKSINTSLEQFDMWLNDHFQMDLTNSKNPLCPACAKKQYDFINSFSHGENYSTLCGRNAVQISPIKEKVFDLDKMKQHLINIGKIEQNPFLLKCYIDNITLVIFKNGRVMIQGTDNITKAKSLYAKYIGS